MIGFQREGGEGREEREGGIREPFEPALMACSDVPPEVNSVSRRIIGCAIEVHRVLGPELLEKFYEEAMCYEFRAASIPHRRQVEITVPYKTIEMPGQRIDLIVAELVVVEIKAVEAIHAAPCAQTLSYLRSTKLPLGLLFNFNQERVTDPMKRILNERSPLVNSHPRSVLPSRSSRPSPTSR